MKSWICLIPAIFSFLAHAESDSKNATNSAPDQNSSSQQGASTASDTTWIDETHDWLYDTGHGSVVWVDGQFVPAGKEPLKVPPSRFRLGLYGEFDFGAADSFELKPIIDLGTDVKFPNLERRLRLFITTRDPSALPGESTADANNNLRIGGSRNFFKNWDTSIGVKADWPPEAFVNAQWAPIYQPGNYWTLYPQGKVFWDNKEGIGFLTSLSADYWRERWLFRQTISGKWNKQNQDDDSDDASNPDSYLFGENGGGYRWAVTSLVGYIPMLLDEKVNPEKT